MVPSDKMFMHSLWLSADAVSPDQSNWENLISPLFTTMKTLVGHFEPKVSWFICYICYA